MEFAQQRIREREEKEKAFAEKWKPKEGTLAELVNNYYEESKDYEGSLCHYDFVHIYMKDIDTIKQGLRWKYYNLFLEELNKMSEEEVETLFLYCRKSKGDIPPIIYIELMKWYKKFAKYALNDKTVPAPTKMGPQHKQSFISFVLMCEITCGTGYLIRINELFNI